MPRREINAPTERIVQILDDVATLEDYCSEVETLLIQLYPEDLHKFPRRPSLEAVLKERARQGITLEQTRRKREYARRVRGLADDHAVEAISLKDLEEKLK